MEERIEESDRDQRGIEYVPPGSNGELEPFIRAHTAKYISMITATEFRRGRARGAAVNYGTGRGVGTPISSATVEDLIFYYNHLVKEAELETESFELYEQFQVKRITIENITLRLREEEQDEKEQRELLEELAELSTQVEELAGRMEHLSRA